MFKIRNDTFCIESTVQVFFGVCQFNQHTEVVESGSYDLYVQLKLQNENFNDPQTLYIILSYGDSEYSSDEDATPSSGLNLTCLSLSAKTQRWQMLRFVNGQKKVLAQKKDRRLKINVPFQIDIEVREPFVSVVANKEVVG
eukprot:TRINITY_DN3718_c0_g1_i2.p1 TRINITY_DN3718_c0_g1~~TRINITY_DN3718_c0_g1_i2.p1  ORF type:complete len:141 (+),score=29.01 TRINITY_DN3718_c0_g1_i2:351-773(+)